MGGTPDLVEKREFWRLLVRDMSYRTPDRPASWTARNMPGLASFVYHSRVGIVIFRLATQQVTGRFNLRRLATGCHDIFRIAESFGGRFHIVGLQHVVEAGPPIVLVANHMGSLETLILHALLLPFGDLTYVVKESLLRYPVFGLMLKGVDPIAVSRRNAREDLKQTLDQGLKMIERERSVVIFPQATRSATFDAAAFNSLGVKLARKAGVPVVPLALKTDFVENGRWIKDFGRIRPERTIHIEFGSPVKIEGNGKEQHRMIKSFIIDRLQTWGVRAW